MAQPTAQQTRPTPPPPAAPRRQASYAAGSWRSNVDVRAGVIATAAVVVLLVLVYLGSGGLKWFDAALAGYLVGVVLAVFATVYRYLIWIKRPPTAMLQRRGWESFRRSGSRGKNVVGLGGLVVTNLLTQGFIRRTPTWPCSRSAWIACQ